MSNSDPKLPEDFEKDIVKIIRKFIIDNNIDIRKEKTIKIPFMRFKDQGLRSFDVISYLDDLDNVVVVNNLIKKGIRSGSIKKISLRISSKKLLDRYKNPNLAKDTLRDLLSKYLIIKIK